MATPINTRILLRNDTLANWEASTLVLGKGEVAIATLADGNLAEVRVGTGSSTWATALKLNVNADQISGLVETIQGTAKQYQVVANDEGGNSWKLQAAALSGGDWSDVTGSTWTVDFSAINDAIDALTTDVNYLSGQINATNATLNTVSSDYLTSADKMKLAGADTYISGQVDALSTTLNTVSSDYLKATDFAALSDDIGLSAASATNHVATQKDIAALDGVMHFKGVVSTVPTLTEGYEVGDVVLVAGSSVEGDNGKEFVLVEVSGTKKWEQIGDQDHYATKSYVDTGDNNTLTASKAYTDGKITDISGTITATYATKTDLTSTAHDLSTDYVGKINTAKTEAYNEALSDANAYTNGVSAALSADYQGKIDYLSNEISTIGDTYATKDYVNGISSALSTDYVGKIKAVDDKLANYALSADVTSGIAAAKSEVIGQSTDLSSADTINGAKVYAKDYTDQAVAGLSVDNFIKHGQVVDTDLSGFFILSCGNATLRGDEPTAPIA